LTTLLENPGATELELFSRPAAWADLIISKGVTTTNDADFDITDAWLQLDYDYHDRTYSQRKELRVGVAEGVLDLEDPPVLCNYGPDRVIENK
jgi:hypothetical protein